MSMLFRGPCLPLRQKKCSCLLQSVKKKKKIEVRDFSIRQLGCVGGGRKGRKEGRYGSCKGGDRYQKEKLEKIAPH